MKNALLEVQTNKNAPVTTKVRADQIKNSDGAYVFGVSDKDRLERFLIIGTDAGTYYAESRDITNQNVDFLRKLIQTNEALVLDTVVDISVNGRAYKQSPVLFTIALLLVEGQNKAATRAAVLKVVRTSTHLFEFAQYIENLGGWGRAKRNAVADWYTSKEASDLAYQLVKYRQRNGWTHRDLLRLSHPVGVDSNLVNFALGKPHELSERIITGFEIVQQATDVQQVLNALSSFKNLPWEAIPTQFLTSDKVWKALFYNSQLKGQALVRNITRLAKNGAFTDMNFVSDFANAITDQEMLIKTKLHPINYLNALVVYENGQQGRFARGKDWTTTPKIVDALNDGFHQAFKTIEPANKRTLLGLDVSASMTWESGVGTDLTAAQVGAAMAMTIARSEPKYDIRGFSHEFRDLGITPKMDLNTVTQKVAAMSYGATNVSLPMKWARENKVAVDTFVIITDNETNTGNHPHAELQKYRDTMGINAALAVVGVTSTGFTVADPKDRRSMDFVGFDSNAPKVLADFSAGRL